MEFYDKAHFKKDFASDEACLRWLTDVRYPTGVYCEKCGRVTPHHMILNRKALSCQNCGRHVHPTATTILTAQPPSS